MYLARVWRCVLYLGAAAKSTYPVQCDSGSETTETCDYYSDDSESCASHCGDLNVDPDDEEPRILFM